MTNAFAVISRPIEVVPENIFQQLENFTIVLYNSTIQITDVNEARKKLFIKKYKQLDKLPPTKAALREHILRTAYQAGHVWGQCTESTPILPDARYWG